ncbi:MAG: hypothetical protein E7254_01605 [Lachnospiraceae bacterium]|nr:hypothetical protein [Lachnospiraceae bacterium]
MDYILQIIRQKNIYINEKYFLWAMGSIFLLGIVGSNITKSIYRGLKREAIRINKSEVKVIKQIKMKYEQFVLINGTMVNTYRMVERYIRNYKVGKIKLGVWRILVNVCELILLLFAGGVATWLYVVNRDREKAVLLILVGGFFTLVLVMYERVMKVEETEEDLICRITDYLDNTLNTKSQRILRTECTVRDMEKRMEEERERSRKKKIMKENIISDILDSYL